MVCLENPIRVDNWDTYRKYRDFCLFGLFKGKYYRVKVLLPHIAIAAAVLGNAFLLYTDRLNILIYSFTIVALFIYLVCLIYFPKMVQKMCLETSALRDSFCRYVFSDDSILIINGKDDFKSNKESKMYEQIKKTYELKRVLYIYFGKNDAIIVEKAHFTSGSPEKLCDFLKAKIGGSKYVLVK